MLTSVQAALDQAITTLMTQAVIHPNLLRAVEGSTGSEPILGFLQYGVLGLVVVGFMTGWIVPGPQAKALAAENARLSGLIEGKLFPMLEKYAGTMERAAQALEKSAEAMDRQAARELSEAQRQIRGGG